MSFMKKLWRKNVERHKQQQRQQLDEHHPHQSSPKTEMRESKGRRVAPSSPETSSSNAFKGASVSKPGAPAEVWTESQVLDFLDSDAPSDDTVGEPAWDPTADALVEMKDEEEEESNAQLASVHTSCRQGEDNRNNNAAPSTHQSPLLENDPKDSSPLPNVALEAEQRKCDPCGNLQTVANDSGPYIEPNVIVVHNENNSDDTNDNSASLYPSDLSSNEGDCNHQGSENDSAVCKQSVDSNEEHSSDSDGNEGDHRHSANPRTNLKLNTAIRPLTPPLGKSPGICQSKGKLKLKAKKNSKGRK